MDADKKKAIKAAGFRFTDVSELLGLSDAERQTVELRVRLARMIRSLRLERGLTQKQVTAMLGMTQPQVARIESAAPGVSLDQMFRGFFAVGGKMGDVSKSRVIKLKSVRGGIAPPSSTPGRAKAATATKSAPAATKSAPVSAKKSGSGVKSER